MKGFAVVAIGASLASVAAAVPLCAINCFQDVVTEHPPLDCTEPDMYHCFCKMPDLQRYFVECAYSHCPSTSESVEAIDFGVDLCDGLGSPITIETDPPTDPTTPPLSEPTTTASPPETTDDDFPSETVEPTDTGSETNPAPPTETDSVDEPSESSGPEPSASPGGDDDDDDDDDSGEGDEGGEAPVTAGATDAKVVSVILAFAGVAAAALV